ncbi:PilT/PilU family type 4a pilus ATPase [bacterium]|nr:PilT/PilU family type 4a pilus ATPase [bacterium]
MAEDTTPNAERPKAAEARLPEGRDKPGLARRLEQLHKLLKLAAKVGASDIHLKPGKVPVLRVNGQLMEVEGWPALHPGDTGQFARLIMNEEQVQSFRRDHDVDLAYSVPGFGRFRANIYQQRGSIAVALRIIPFELPELRKLSLPPVIERIAHERRGLVLVTGTTGSGKSTTLAGIVNHINSTRAAHIITIEDPIEFLFADRKSMIAQREVGLDAGGFHRALRSALRQDPDVILIGELRDPDTITTALMAAETGHLVLATLHTLDVMETIHRIIAFYDGPQAQQVRYQFSSVIRAIICQRLLTRLDGQGRIPAVEVMVATSRIAELIKEPHRTHEIREAISQGYSNYGMQTFDMCLSHMVLEKKISYEEALDNCTNQGDFELKFKGVSSTSDAEHEEYQRLSKKGEAPVVDNDMVIERFSK